MMSHQMPSNEYQELTAAEVAGRLHCTTADVYGRENKGELFAILTPAPVNERRYPAFQLHKRLDKQLLKQIIQEYRTAGASMTLLWSFLRRSQKEFGGQTAVDMLLGATAPAYDGLSQQERVQSIMEVVSEELSRVTQ